MLIALYENLVCHIQILGALQSYVNMIVMIKEQGNVPAVNQ